MNPMVQGQLKEWFTLLAMFGFFAWIVYLGASIARRKQKYNMQKALLEKFSSAHDFAEFMQSPAGQKYVLSFADAVISPRGSIVNSIRTGFVLMFSGMGCLVGAAGDWVLFRIGWISVLAGVGFLISSGVAYLLTRKTESKEHE